MTKEQLRAIVTTELADISTFSEDEIKAILSNGENLIIDFHLDSDEVVELIMNIERNLKRNGIEIDNNYALDKINTVSDIIEALKAHSTPSFE